MSNDGYSQRGFFGEIIHFDSDGNKIGESRPNLFGGYTNYDSEDNEAGHSEHGLFGELEHYDTDGHITGHSQPDFFGSAGFVTSVPKSCVIPGTALPPFVSNVIVQRFAVHFA